jgi:hypothetical protein
MAAYVEDAERTGELPAYDAGQGVPRGLRADPAARAGERG